MTPLHQAQAQDYSFSQAWQKLLSVNNTLVAEKENTAKAKAKKKAARSLYGPEISVSARYLYLDDDVVLEAEDVLDNMADGGESLKKLATTIGSLTGNSIDISNFDTTLADQSTLTSSLTAIWPVYTGGRVSAAQDIAQGQYLEAVQHQNLVKRQQFAELAKRYFGVVFAEQVYQTRRKVELGLGQHVKDAILLEREGQIAKVERLQATASRDKARVERKSSEHTLAIARNALATILNDKDFPIPVDSLFYNKELPPLETFIKRTVNNFAGLGILKSKKEQAQGMVNVEKGTYLPEVAVLGNYSIYEDESLATDVAPDWFVGINVSFTLFDRNGRADKLQAAQSSVRQVNALIAQAETDITLLCEQFYRKALQAREEYEGFASGIELAKEGLNLRQKAFAQGLSTSLDVVDAELFLAGMQIRRSQSQYNYVIALSQLLSLTGEVESFGHYQEMAVR